MKPKLNVLEHISKFLKLYFQPKFNVLTWTQLHFRFSIRISRKSYILNFSMYSAPVLNSLLAMKYKNVLIHLDNLFYNFKIFANWYDHYHLNISDIISCPYLLKTNFNVKFYYFCFSLHSKCSTIILWRFFFFFFFF